jgi:hypothetical protein
VTQSVAFVTPSYRLDRDRCALLSRSLDACAPSVEHWIVVDRGDLPHFRTLQNHRTHVVAKEEVLPVWVHRLDTIRIGLRSNVWIQARGRPIRGWLLQQLVKLAMAPHLTADVIVHADSDVVLVRPFSTSTVVDAHGRVRLYSRPDEIDEGLPDHVVWHRSAENLLGIAQRDLPLPNFISSLVTWQRASAVALLEHIERHTGSHWLRAVSAAWHVSEHTLYGRFAQDVVGEGAGGFVSSPSLCQDYYKRDPLSASEFEAFLDRLSPHEFAVSLTAKGGMRPADYVEVLERRWATGDDVRPERDDSATEGMERVRMPQLVGSEPRGGKVRQGVRSRLGSGWRRRLADSANGYAGVGAIAAVVGLVIALLFFVD